MQIISCKYTAYFDIFTVLYTSVNHVHISEVLYRLNHRNLKELMKLNYIFHRFFKEKEAHSIRLYLWWMKIENVIRNVCFIYEWIEDAYAYVYRINVGYLPS